MGFITDRLLDDSLKQDVRGGLQSEQQTFKSLSDPVIQKKSGEKTVGLLGSFKAGVPINRIDAIKVLSKEMNIPESQFVIDDKGDIGYKAEDGKYYPAIGSKPAYYAPDVMQTGVDVGAGILSLPTGAASIPITATVSGGTEYLRQKAGQTLADSDTFDPLRIGIATVASGVGETVPYAYRGIKGGKLAKDIDMYNPANIEQMLKLSKQYNIPLTIPELTDLASLKQVQSTLSRIPETASKYQSFYNLRAQDVDKATKQFLDDFSIMASDEAGGAAREALIKKQQNLIKQRKEATEGLYKEAFKDAPPVDVSPIVKSIDEMLVNAKGSQVKALEDMKNLFYTDIKKTVDGKEVTEKILDTRPEALQNAKIELDSKIKYDDNFRSLRGNSSIEKIRGELNAATKINNPAYQEADRLFSELSKPIKEFEESRAGRVLANVADEDLFQFSQKLFRGSDPKTISKVKSQIIETNPEAWEGIMRQYFNKVWDDSLNAGGIRKADIPVDVGAVFANNLNKSDTKRALKAALSKEQYEGLEDFLKVLKASGSVVKTGSDSQIGRDIVDRLQARTLNIVNKVLAPRQSILSWANDAALGKNANVLADILLDPEKLKKLKELDLDRKNSGKYLAGFVQLIVDSGVAEEVPLIGGIPGTTGSPSAQTDQSKLEFAQQAELKNKAPKSITEQLLGF